MYLPFIVRDRTRVLITRQCSVAARVEQQFERNATRKMNQME